MKRYLSLLLVAFVVLGMVSFGNSNGVFAATQKDNLLKNPSFESFVETEDGLVATDWVDETGTWGCDNKNTLTSTQQEQVDGRYYCWPKITSKYPGGKGASDGQHMSIYQDVDISNYKVGTVFELSGLIFNYNQSPHDESVLTLTYLDENGKSLGTASSRWRNPTVKRAIVTLKKPTGATRIRVTCTANGYVGKDVDGYFDDLNLIAKGTKGTSIVIFGDASCKPNTTTTLVAYNGSTVNPSQYTWDSSYEMYAKVDDKGKVTLTSNYKPEEGVTIYATDKKTNMTSQFYFGNKVTNAQDSVLKKTTGLKATQVGKTSFVLRWTKNKDAKGYYIQKYNATKKAWDNVGTIKSKSTVTCTVKSLKRKTSYKVRVVAFTKFATYEHKVKSEAITVKTK